MNGDYPHPHTDSYKNDGTHASRQVHGRWVQQTVIANGSKYAILRRQSRSFTVKSVIPRPAILHRAVPVKSLGSGNQRGIVPRPITFHGRAQDVMRSRVYPQHMYPPISMLIGDTRDESHDFDFPGL